MKNNTIIREMRNEERGAFQTINKAYGFDFEKDFSIAKIDGAFTINKVLKTIGADPKESKVVILMRCGVDYGYRAGKLYAVEITGTGTSDFDVEGLRCKGYGKLDYFCSKGYFNDYRKTAACCYIIAQRKEDLANIYEEKKPDLTGRLTEKEQEILNGWRWNRYNHIRREFDKSGYYLNDKRDNLKRRAEALRKERKADAFKATDNAAVISELQNQLHTLKDAIAAQLTQATTAAQLRTIEKSLAWYKGLGDCFGQFEYIKKGEEEKTFSSVDAFNKRVEDLKANIETIKKGVA